MRKFEGYYFDGKSSKPRNITLELRDDSIYLVELGLSFGFSEITVRTKLKNTPQTISFEDGSYCEMRADDFFVLPDNRGSRFILYIESKLRYAFASFAVLAALTLFMLTVGSSYIAYFLSDKIPQSVIDKMSAQSLEFLDEQYLEPSKLPDRQQKYIQRQFKKIGGGNYTLHFRSSQELEANAFALPSGDIILLDDLVKLDKDEKLRGITAVLAHESGHVAYRHGIQAIIKSSISSALLGYFIGDFSGLATSVITFALDARYSREHENEADIYAIKTMNDNNISTKYIADLFENFSDNGSNKSSFWSSHPQTSSRIKKFREN
jgi:Zn-dependent protease with chaperone function